MQKPIGVAGLVIVLVSAGAGALADAPVKTVALKNDAPPAPPAPPAFYKRFERPVASDTAGSTAAFVARIAIVASGGSKGVFKEDPDAAGSTVVLKGDTGPDSREYSKFGDLSMNAAGDVAFDAQLTGGLKGVFRDPLDVVSFLGDPIPAVTGLLDGFSKTAITNAGDVIFKGTISGAAEVAGVDLDEGIFRCTGGDGDCSSGTGTLEVLVLRNDDVSDRVGRKFCTFNKIEASNFGIVFVASTSTDCSGGGDDRNGTFRLPFGGAITTVALEGEASQPFPDPGGTTYGRISDPADIATDGTVVFKARTTGILSVEILFQCDPADCPSPDLADIIVQQGEPDAEGAVFKKFGAPVISDDGDIPFKAIARGDTGTVKALYVYRADTTLERVIAKGDEVPDIPGAEFRSLYVRQSRLHVSSGGTLAFNAKVRQPSGSPRSAKGIFVAELFASPSGAFLEPASTLWD